MDQAIRFVDMMADYAEAHDMLVALESTAVAETLWPMYLDGIELKSFSGSVRNLINGTMAQMALTWNVRHEEVTSVLVGASRVHQIEENVAALKNLQFTEEELQDNDRIMPDCPLFQSGGGAKKVMTPGGKP